MFAALFLCLVISACPAAAAASVDKSSVECISRKEFEARLGQLENRLNIEIQTRKDLELEIEFLKASRYNTEQASDSIGPNKLQELNKLDVQSRKYSKSNSQNDLKNGASKDLTKQDDTTETSGGNVSKTAKIQDKEAIPGNSRILNNGATGEGAAFTVDLVKNLEGLGLAQTIIFDNMVSQLGNGFDMRTGTFQATTPGWYVFTLTMMIDENQEMELHIVNDDLTIARCYEKNSNDVDSVTETVVIYLGGNSEVWVQTHPTVVMSQSLVGDHHTTFSGFLFYTNQT